MLIKLNIYVVLNSFRNIETMKLASELLIFSISQTTDGHTTRMNGSEAIVSFKDRSCKNQAPAGQSFEFTFGNRLVD